MKPGAHESVNLAHSDFQAHWDAVMWCCTRAQLAEVAARIRADRGALPEEELARLRAMYRLRWQQLEAASSLPSLQP